MSLLKGGSLGYQNEEEKKSKKALDESKKGGRRVGVRNAKRDKVGVDDNVL